MLRQQLYIAGSWRDGVRVMEVRSPWDDALVGTFAVASVDDVSDAIASAHDALRRGLAPHLRAGVLDRLVEVIGRRAEEFSEVLSEEAGKPITAARGEVQRALTTFRLSADEARRLPGEAVQLDGFAVGEGMLALTVPEPLGVVAAITPFNFPLNLVAHKVGPAIAAGCPIVLKPSERTPLTAGLLVEALEEAGLPAGWINLVTGDPREIVPVLQQDDRVAVLTFTGSAEVGWQLKAGSPKKHHVLELGSNTGMVVDRDADLGLAVTAALGAAYGYAGQACVSLQRLFVHEGVVDEFIARFAVAVKALKVGDPRDEQTVVGPLITKAATERVQRWLADAVGEGAQIVAGGAIRDGVLEPTAITRVKESSPLLCDEVFGPVVTIVPVSDVREGIRQLNLSRFGLNTAIFTNDLANALGFARSAESGSVLINIAPSFRADQMPYGGVKDSGQGREGVKYAVSALVAPKLVVFGPTGSDAL